MKTIELIPLSEPVHKTIEIPGSKSYTNRALIMAALTKGRVILRNPLESDDTQAMISCLETLGIKIIKKVNELIIENDITEIQDKNYELNANLSGTTIRFITALSCIIPGTKKVFGEDGLNKRPIKDLVDGLTQMGAEIEYESEQGFPPLVIKSKSLQTKAVELSGTISSQFLSALLMISPLIGDVHITINGDQISKSYIDITLSMMKEWGITVENDEYRNYFIKGGQSYSMKNYTIEGDFSAAGYFFAIGALTHSTITLRNMNSLTVQGDKQFLDYLSEMGNDGTCGKNEITIIGKNIKPVQVNMEQCPDQAQTLAVLAAFAEGKSIITGVRSLRVKETERVKAVQTELEKMGVRTESPDVDTLIIYGGNPQPAEIDTYGDHRMAMSFAVAGSKLKGLKIRNPEVVNKTFPEFWKKLKQLGIDIK